MLEHPDVVAGTVDTGWIERTWHGEAPTLPADVAADADPRDPWQAFGPRRGADPELVVAGDWAQYRGWSHRIAGDDLDPVGLPLPGGSLAAPIPATVRRIDVAEGDRVSAGDAMVVLEAMKMQMSVRTPSAGTVTAVHVREGDVVAAGQVLIAIEDDPA